MRFPWFNRETRSRDAEYTRQVEQAAIEQAMLGPSAAEATAALETCASMYARAFASATVQDAPANVADAITPDMLATVGRSLLCAGESVWRIEVMRGMLALRAACHHYVEGGPDPETWSYRLQLSGPTITRSVTLPGASVLHFRYSVDPEQPWHGIPPLQRAALTAALLGVSESYLSREGRLPSGYIVPSVAGRHPTATTTRNTTAALNESVAAGGFRAVSDRDRRQPQRHWQPIQYGPTPNPGMLGLRSDAALAVLAACGVPPSLVQPNSDGTAQRESYRRWLFGTVAPIARCVERELRDKLDAPTLRLSFDELFAADLTGRARAVHSLTQSGVPLNIALAVARLDDNAGNPESPPSPPGDVPSPSRAGGGGDP
ncbi:MAG: phage portal protein [Gemmatimonadetes bacterium]|nr:phage portal protein [Gemmatimonadota bacterium]